MEYDDIDKIDYSKTIITMELYDEDKDGFWDLVAAHRLDNGKYKIIYTRHENGWGYDKEDLGIEWNARDAADKLVKFSVGCRPYTIIVYYENQKNKGETG